MREIGPVNKSLSGDPDTAAAQVSVARTQLGILKNLMKLGGLKIGSRTVRLADGTTIQVASFNGQDFINIETAVPVNTPPVDVPVTVLTPEEDLVLQLAFDQFALFNGVIVPDSDNGRLFRPAYLDDVLVSAPDSKPRFLSPHTPLVRYRRTLGTAHAMPVARTDIATGLPLDLGLQPTTFTVKTLAGEDTGLAWESAYDIVHVDGLKTLPPNLGYVSFPDVGVDTVVVIEGLLNGHSVAKGQVLVERTIQLGIVCPMQRSAQYGGDGSVTIVDGTGTANGFPLNFDVNQVIPCANSLTYTYSFAPIVPPGTDYPPTNLGFLLFQMTADPSAETAVIYNFTSPIYNSQGVELADYMPNGAATWTQGGGDITFALSGRELLQVSGDITTKGTYTSTGTLTWMDGLGTMQTVVISISYTAQ